MEPVARVEERNVEGRDREIAGELIARARCRERREETGIDGDVEELGRK